MESQVGGAQYKVDTELRNKERQHYHNNCTNQLVIHKIKCRSANVTHNIEKESFNF